MKEFDRDGYLACTIQGNVFALSSEKEKCSSPIFIRRFMNSEIAREFDSLAILDDTLTEMDVLQVIDEEFGETSYGSIKYEKEVLFWIGYIYRYFCYTYDISSLRAYKILKPKEMYEAYYVYHTYDPSKAIAELLEEKGISFDPVKENERLLSLIRTYLYKENVHIEEEPISSKSKETHYNVFFRERNVGSIQLERKRNGVGKLKISLNDDAPKPIEMDEAVLNKAVEETKRKKSIHTLLIELSKENEAHIQMYKKAGFKYQNEDPLMVSYSKELG